MVLLAERWGSGRAGDGGGGARRDLVCRLLLTPFPSPPGLMDPTE